MVPEETEAGASAVAKYFTLICRHPKLVVITCLLLALALASALPQLHKDTRTDAFVPVDHPARTLNRQFRETFGLGDPMVIAVVNTGPTGIFNPQSLTLIHWLSRQLEQVPNIDPERITSLATEHDIRGTAAGMEVEPLLPTPPRNQAEAEAVRRAVLGFPLHVGAIVAADGSGALIVAEQLDPDRAQQTYDALLALIARAPLGDGDQLHVTGEGALAGYMGTYIDADATRLSGVSTLVILLLCLAAFRTLRGMWLPGLVVLTTATSTLGAMALAGVPFYIITNALPVALIGIAVADSIHILTRYYKTAAQFPEWTREQLAVTAMCGVFRPISLTSLTTMAGFLSLALSAMMPPMRWFGWFALLGVGIAWFYSVTLLPALLALLRPQRSPAYRSAGAGGVITDRMGRLLRPLGNAAQRRPGAVLGAAAIVVVVGISAIPRIEVNDSLIRAFQDNEPIVLADREINRRFDGSYFLDILVTTPDTEGLFEPDRLRRIEALQTQLNRHPLIADTVSIIDYLKQMHRAMHGDNDDFYRLPENPELIAQYFLLYASLGDPREFDHLIDYDYRLANVRVTMKSDYYADLRQVIDFTRNRLEQTFDDTDLQGQPTGRAYLNYVWMRQLAQAQSFSVLLALALVLAMASLSFRSLRAGLVTLSPVAITVLGIYAYMGFGGLWLSVSTTMFAAIAIGLGIDFAIHTTERLHHALTREGHDSATAIARLYPETGRALLFNFLALALGFGVLAFSKVQVLNEFGITVALAITLSFLASLLLIPALTTAFPRLLSNRAQTAATHTVQNRGSLP